MSVSGFSCLVVWDGQGQTLEAAGPIGGEVPGRTVEDQRGSRGFPGRPGLAGQEVSMGGFQGGAGCVLASASGWFGLEWGVRLE